MQRLFHNVKRRAATRVAFPLVVILACMLPPLAQAQLRPPQISVVVQQRGAPQQVLALDPETGAQTVLIDSLGGRDLRWSPDGERLVYQGQWNNLEARQIIVMNADGTGRRVVSLWEQDGHLEPELFGTKSSPVWSPDGEQVAYTRCVDCEVGGSNTEVYVVALDTTDGLKKARLTETPYTDRVLDWSPEGERILYRSGLAPDSSWDSPSDVYTMASDGTDRQRVLINDSTFHKSNVRYTPDGENIVFVGERRGEQRELYLAEADGSNIRQVTDNDLIESYPTLSPDGTRLLFKTNHRYVEGHVYVVNVDGTGLRKLTSADPRYRAPEWRPPDASIGTAPPAAPPGGLIMSVFPNPAVRPVTVRFVLAWPSAVSLAVYDVLGREVARLVDRRMEAGTHTAVFDAEGLPSGTYLYRLTAGAYVETQRMVLLK